MSRWLKRSIPLFGIAGLIACCVLGARAVNHYLDARYLGESSEPRWTKIDQRPKAPVVVIDHSASKNGAAVAERNMFCAECTDAEPEPEPAQHSTGGVPLSDLPLELLATNVTRPVQASFATVRNRESGQQGSFFTGDRMPGAGPIERIDGSSVIFHNPQHNRRERISLFAARPADTGRNRATSAGRGQRSTTARAKRRGNPYADKIIKIDDTTYEVERSLVDNLITSPHKLGARVRPTTAKDSGSVAFKVYGVRSSSPLAAIGIRSGDSIEAINGFTMTTDPDKLLEMYTKLQNEQRLSVSVRRGSQLFAMNYRVR